MKIMKEAKTIYVKNRREWRSWLQKNHKSSPGVWLIYYKKHTGKPTIPYTDAVEEAICFGWIDGQIKTMDENRYKQRYTPRTSKSRWSEINIERAKKIIKQGKMSRYGLEIFRTGTKTRETVPSSKNFSIPNYFKKALSANKKARNNFKNFSPSAKLAYVYWVNTAKTEATRQKRIKETVRRLTKNKKVGEP